MTENNIGYNPIVPTRFYLHGVGVKWAHSKKTKLFNILNQFAIHKIVFEKMCSD